MTQPPSFEPAKKAARPDSSGAKEVVSGRSGGTGSTSEQLQEWAAIDGRPPRRQRSLLEKELGIDPNEQRGSASQSGSASQRVSRSRSGAAEQLGSAPQGRSLQQPGSAQQAGSATSASEASHSARRSGSTSVARPGGSARRLDDDPAAGASRPSQPSSYPPASRGGPSASSQRPSGGASASNLSGSQSPQRPDSLGGRPLPAPTEPFRAAQPQDPTEPPRGPTQPPQGPTESGGGLYPPSKPRRRHPWRRRIGIALVVLLVLLIAWPAYLIHYGNSKLHDVDALSDKADTPGTTYLVVGSDKREKGAIDDPTAGQRSDTIMLLHVPESGKPALVSLPRDAYVTIPGNNAGKLNAAYSIGGPKLLVRTVEELSGLKVDHYIEVSMGGVQSLVEAVGGVNLCYDADVNDRDSGLVWTKGCHDADGPTALAFSRMRKADPLGDIGRALRQRQVVSKVVSKAASPSTLINPMRQRSLVGTVAEHLTVDPDTGMVALGKAGLSIRGVMGPDGLMGAPPISSMNYRVGQQSAVRLDPAKIDGFFEKLRNGTLTSSDFFSPL